MRGHTPVVHVTVKGVDVVERSLSGHLGPVLGAADFPEAPTFPASALSLAVLGYSWSGDDRDGGVGDLAGRYLLPSFAALRAVGGLPNGPVLRSSVRRDGT